ncbi:MAG TPA: hypothetical protein VKU85_15360 [bacterium]|nr:hypothetical protein [bacterium]
MKGALTKSLAIAAMVVFATTAWADLTSYSQDFEGLVQADPAALGNDGWLYFANVFDGTTSGFLYNYGPGPAPNGGPAFSAIATGQGGASQGAQQLVVYSDYNNGDHNNGNIIEANVFQEQVIGAVDVGTEWTFMFDAKLGDILPNSTALAFIKTLDPNAGFALSNFITVDMTSIPATWSTYSLSIAIDAPIVGHIFQIGFLNTATNFTPSGIFYDNINFGQSGPVSVESRSWGGVKSLYR